VKTAAVIAAAEAEVVRRPIRTSKIIERHSDLPSSRIVGGGHCPPPLFCFLPLFSA
jgi:hypothetical protein